jgi:tetratricopeptide (TPR) repeat protein
VAQSFADDVNAVDLSRSPGSIEDVVARLLLWVRRDGKGLAQVEYSSEFSRQRVVARLESDCLSAGLSVRRIVLPSNQAATVVMEYFLGQLARVNVGSVVLVTGFAEAFGAQGQRGGAVDEAASDALRTLNFNRDALVKFPVRQVWWMTPVVSQMALYAMPDLNGWFSPKLRLVESILADAGMTELEPNRWTSSRVSIQDAYSRTSDLLGRFEQARLAGAADLELLTIYLLPALENLADVGAQRELQDLTLKFEGLLGEIRDIDQPEMAASLGRLGCLYFAQGNYSKAEPLLLKALKMRKKQFGDYHPDTAMSMNDLAALYKSQGRYKSAEQLYLEALKIINEQLGDRHLSTSTSMNNLALLYVSQGRYESAEPLFLESLEIRKEQLGDRHLSTATSMNNLGGLYESQGRYELAEPLYLEALEIKKEQLGDRHPSTATSMNNLALLYQSMSRYGLAELLYLEALEIKKEQLGDRHPSTATSMNNLGGLYESQGRYELAEPLYLEALEIRKEQLGDRHPKIATSMNNLAALYKSQGRYELAEPLYLEALEIRKEQLGDRHPEIATSMNNLALLYSKTDRLSEAVIMMSEAVKILQQSLGNKHPNTINGQKGLALFQKELKDSESLKIKFDAAIKKQNSLQIPDKLNLLTNKPSIQPPIDWKLKP